MRFDELDLNDLKPYREARNACNRLHEKLHELEIIVSSPKIHINEYADREIALIQAKRNEEMRRLDLYYEKLMNEVNMFRNECLLFVTDENNMTVSKLEEQRQGLNTVKASLMEAEKSLNSFKLDEAMWHTAQQTAIKFVPLLDELMKKFKVGWQMNMECRFDANTMVMVEGRHYIGEVRRNRALVVIKKEQRQQDITLNGD